MKILFCTNTYSNVTNGPTKFIQLLKNYLDNKENIEIKVLTEDVGATNSGIINIDFPDFWKTNPLGNIFRIVQYYRQSKRIFKKYEYDYIVYNNAFIGLMTCIFENSKFVGMVNDYSNVCPEKGLRSHEYFKRSAFKVLERFVCRRSKIIVNSSFMSDILVDIYKLEKHKVFVLNKGLELPSSGVYRSFQAYQSLRDRRIRILFVKADFYTGGLDILIDAMSLSKYLYTLEVIGPRDVDQLTINGWISKTDNIDLVFKGEMSNELINKSFIENDFFVVPSRKEAFGLANVEAMSLGCPIISVPTGGIPEVLDYGRAGFLANSLNPNDLKETLEYGIENPLEVQKRVAFASNYVMKYKFSNVVDNFIDILTC